ncbi:MAG: hypothetical protein LBI48_06590 [Burkholderiaceae bacterium]|jgi:hypothetical protein|nr:hypothetical protein [Burkholderiaceae bacterium]
MKRFLSRATAAMLALALPVSAAAQIFIAAIGTSKNIMDSRFRGNDEGGSGYAEKQAGQEVAG